MRILLGAIKSLFISIRDRYSAETRLLRLENRLLHLQEQYLLLQNGYDKLFDAVHKANQREEMKLKRASQKEESDSTQSSPLVSSPGMPIQGMEFEEWRHHKEQEN